MTATAQGTGVSDALSGSVLLPLWLDSDSRPQPREPLAHDTEVDILVVGGGFTGLCFNDSDIYKTLEELKK